MQQFVERDTQTRVKHEILAQYLEKWTYIITGGLKGTYERLHRNGLSGSASFVYVDCFANTGCYQEEGQVVYGSPVIGVRAMDFLRQHFRDTVGSSPGIISVLIEKDPKRYKTLIENLCELGYGDRIRETNTPQSLRAGDIGLLNGSCLDYVDELLALTGRKYTWSFYFLDPYGPAGVPLGAVSRIVSQEHIDAIINLMYIDLERKAGSVAKAEPGHPHEIHHEHYDAMYGTSEWREIAKDYDADKLTQEQARIKYINLYRYVLQSRDQKLAVKEIPLKFRDRERIMYYLFLTTHDGTGALSMNEILDSAKISEHDYREVSRRQRKQQMSFFEPQGMPDRPTLVEPESKDVGEEIYGLCKGQKLEYREVLRRLVDTYYYPRHIKPAISWLKKQKRLTYEGDLKHGTIVNFH
jgi:three-Cys-motif partner protein